MRIGCIGVWFLPPPSYLAARGRPRPSFTLHTYRHRRMVHSYIYTPYQVYPLEQYCCEEFVCRCEMKSVRK